MTVPIRRGSPRAAPARKFARELRKAMETRKIGRRRLAMAMGLKSDSIIAQWRTGNSLPRLDSASAVAEVLEWPQLRLIVEGARTQTCARPSCDITFVNELPFLKVAPFVVAIMYRPSPDGRSGNLSIETGYSINRLF